MVILSMHLKEKLNVSLWSTISSYMDDRELQFTSECCRVLDDTKKCRSPLFVLVQQSYAMPQALERPKVCLSSSLNDKSSDSRGSLQKLTFIFYYYWYLSLSTAVPRRVNVRHAAVCKILAVNNEDQKWPHATATPFRSLRFFFFIYMP